jgi:hypothetical protein
MVVTFLIVNRTSALAGLAGHVSTAMNKHKVVEVLLHTTGKPIVLMFVRLLTLGGITPAPLALGSNKSQPKIFRLAVYGQADNLRFLLFFGHAHAFTN